MSDSSKDAWAIYRDVVEGTPDALVLLDGDGVITFVNTAAELLFGRRRDELVGLPYAALLPARLRETSEDVRGVFAADTRMGQIGTDLELFGLHSDGAEFPVEVNLAHKGGVPGAGMVVSIRDARTRKRNEMSLRRALSLVTATLESTADGILVVTADGRIAGANERFGAMWGIPGEVMESGDDGQVMNFVLDQLNDPAAFVAKVEELYADPEAESLDLLAFRDGRTFERYSRPQRVSAKIVGRVWSFRDITPRIKAEEDTKRALAELAIQAEKLKRLAFRDPLTGLANRALIRQRLERALLSQDQRGVQVLLLDLDDFKEVNDVLGHQAGDELLVEIGHRLLRCVEPDDTVGRLGGDEFVVLLTEAPDPGPVAARILTALNTPFILHGQEVRPGVSIGVTGADGGLHGPDLLRRADIAMYEAKAAGKNRCLPFHPTMMTALLVRTDLEAGLRTAVERGEITVHFQPVVNTRQGRVTQVEALVRWERSDGMVPPAEFIPAAESSGLINTIGQEVLRITCAELGPWLARDPERSAAVNVSAIQLREPGYAATVLALLEESGVRAKQLILEVTESVFLDTAHHITEQLGTLRRHGLRVALDDFGTGYSSLGRLQDLPVDILKIDRTFVSVIQTGDEHLPILTSMITMAHNLGLAVTAEGIETTNQAHSLTRLGSDSLQGYYFSRPVPIADLCQAEQEATARAGQLPNFLRLPNQ